MYIGFIQSFVTLVTVEDQFEKPAVSMAGISDFRLEILIRLEHDDTEQVLFSVFLLFDLCDGLYDGPRIHS